MEQHIRNRQRGLSKSVAVSIFTVCSVIILLAYSFFGGALEIPTERDVSASKQPPELGTDYSSVMRAQVSLDKAASEIKDTFKGQSGVGYAGLSVETKNRAITIYWKGDIPTATEQAIELVRGQGVGVSILQAQYSREELQAEITRIREWDQKNVAPAYRAHTYIPLHDGSGIEIYVLKRNPRVEQMRNTSGMIHRTVERPAAIPLNW